MSNEWRRWFWLRPAGRGRGGSTRWSRRRRLQAVGIAILAIGLDLAVVTYRARPRENDPLSASILHSAELAKQRQMGILYGSRGATMIAWVDALGEPSGRAVLIAVASLVGALVCFRVASLSGPDRL